MQATGPGFRSRDALCYGVVAPVFACAFLWPALWNGYALLRFDSAGYVLDAWTLRFFEARPQGYALFLRPFLAGGTSWLALLAQSLGTSLLALRLGMILCPWARSPLRVAAVALAAALVLSALGVHSSTLMPDVFTGWLLLGGTLALVATRPADILLGIFACFASLLVHSTHLPLALALIFLAFVATRWGPLAQPRVRYHLGLLAALVPLALATQASLARVTGHPGPLTGHPAFLVARQHTMGVLVDTLAHGCGEHHWQLCEYRETLARHPTDDAAWFLWYRESPFGRIGRFSARDELGEIAWQGMREAWPRIAARTLRGTWQQLFLVESATELDSRPARGYALAVRRELPREALQAAGAEQASGRPVLVGLFAPHEGALHAALLAASALVAWLCLRRGLTQIALWIAATLLFQVLHALVVSFGTSPLGRYQGRVAWLVPFALALGLAGLVSRQAKAYVPPFSSERFQAGRS